MKRILIVLLTVLPLWATAQDNTWERIEVEPVEKDNPDARYLLPDAVPVIDGKVCWETTIEAPGKSARQIYDILLKQLEKMVAEPNQIENSIVAGHDAPLMVSFLSTLVIRKKTGNCTLILRTVPCLPVLVFYDFHNPWRLQ